MFVSSEITNLPFLILHGIYEQVAQATNRKNCKTHRFTISEYVRSTTVDDPDTNIKQSKINVVNTDSIAVKVTFIMDNIDHMVNLFQGMIYNAISPTNLFQHICVLTFRKCAQTDHTNTDTHQSKTSFYM